MIYKNDNSQFSAIFKIPEIQEITISPNAVNVVNKKLLAQDVDENKFQMISLNE